MKASPKMKAIILVVALCFAVAFAQAQMYRFDYPKYYPGHDGNMNNGYGYNTGGHFFN